MISNKEFILSSFAHMPKIQCLAFCVVKVPKSHVRLQTETSLGPASWQPK